MKKASEIFEDPKGSAFAECVAEPKVDPQLDGSVSTRKLIDHMEFFKLTLDGSIKLCNDQGGDIFASWKVGGQDFYIYGKKQNKVITT